MKKHAHIDAWNEFQNFYNDVGEDNGRYIGRPDEACPFGPENFVWRNRWTRHKNSGMKIISANGVSKSMTEWSREFGISRERLRQRLDRGDDIVDLHVHYILHTR